MPEATEAKAPRKVAIVGTAEPHWRNAPYDDESWEIWSLGGNYVHIPRWNRWFEMHRLEDTCKGWGQSPEQENAQRQVYIDWLGKNADKLVVQELRPEVEGATRYPIEDVLRVFPDGYFTNSVSYMMALALMEGVSEIGLWGIDMALSGDGEGDEYARQRPSVEFFLGLAMGSGVKTHLPPETNLLKCRKLYAYGPANDGYMSVLGAKKEEVRQRLQVAKRQKAQVKHQLHEAEKFETGMETALEIIGFMERNWEV